MRIHAIQCKKCKDIIYSCALHDYMPCTCGEVTIDGGVSDYIKISGGDVSKMKLVELEVDATKVQLYEDWGKSNPRFPGDKKKRKYGRILRGKFRKYEREYVEPLNIHKIT